MTNFIVITILVQAFCMYHIYNNRNEKFWYVIILFFPFLGALAYFIMHFYSRSKIQTVQEVATPGPESNFQIVHMETEEDFPDTVSHKIRHADELMKKQNYEKAVELLESCLSKLTKDDEELNKKLLVANYKNVNYLEAVMIGDRLNKEKHFQDSYEKTIYAWSYFELHGDDKAEVIFQEMNKANTNYYHRKEFLKFLLEVEKKEDAQKLIGELMEEFSSMDSYEKKINKEIFAEIKKLKT